MVRDKKSSCDGFPPQPQPTWWCLLWWRTWSLLDQGQKLENYDHLSLNMGISSKFETSIEQLEPMRLNKGMPMMQLAPPPRLSWDGGWRFHAWYDMIYIYICILNIYIYDIEHYRTLYNTISPCVGIYKFIYLYTHYMCIYIHNIVQISIHIYIYATKHHSRDVSMPGHRLCQCTQHHRHPFNRAQRTPVLVGQPAIRGSKWKTINGTTDVNV